MGSHKWLHLYAFFNCLLKLSAQKDVKSHWLHLYVFFKRLLKLCARTDAKSHRLHLYAFSPKGVFRCFLKWKDGKSQMVALVRFFRLSPQIVCPNRCKVALVAFLHFFTWGSFQMFSQIACLDGWKVALIAFERLFTWGSFQMFSQIACLNRWKVTLIAFERLFTWGSFQMFSQVVCMNRCKVTNGCICTFFSTVSSNRLPEQMQSRIDCICTLLVGAVSQKRLLF